MAVNSVNTNIIEILIYITNTKHFGHLISKRQIFASSHTFPTTVF